MLMHVTNLPQLMPVTAINLLLARCVITQKKAVLTYDSSYYLQNASLTVHRKS